jgi:hypothetical protein
MLRSVIQKSKKTCFLIILLALVLIHFSFKTGMTEQEMLVWGNRCLSESYDPSGEVKLKKWEIMLTPDAFVRLKKDYTNGKEEYYSFQLHRYKDMNYLGTTTAGNLQLTAIADDIIVQTKDDPKGDIDSMATQMTIPMKNMEPERLDSLQELLKYFKGKSL